MRWGIRTYLLAEVSNWLVIFVEDNADLVHQPNLLFIVTIERCRAGVDVWEEAQNILSCDGLQLGGICSRHCEGRGSGVYECDNSLKSR